MTFFKLLLEFQNKYGVTKQNIFFDLVFSISKKVKTKLLFIENKNNPIDFSKKRFDNLCNKYFLKNISLAHLTKKTCFCGLTFFIDKKVLAPRDITQQMTCDFIKHIKNKKGIKVYDLCAGSGNIGIAIKKHCPNADVICLDKYQYCIDNIKKNCQLNKAKIKIIKENVLKFLNKSTKLDYIISNPPYIDFINDKYIVNTDWESKNALFAKDKGLFFFKKYFEWLNKNNFKECWLEYGTPQKLKIASILKKYPKIQYKFIKNYLIIFKKYNM